MAGSQSHQQFLFRAGLIVGVSTFLLTSSFIGLLALMSGAIANISQRLPLYLIVTGILFVGTIFLLEEHDTDGGIIIITAFIVGVLTFVIVGLSVEGILFTLNNPEIVFVSQLIFYLIAAGLIGTGIAYWGIRHWREFTHQSRGGL